LRSCRLADVGLDRYVDVVMAGDPAVWTRPVGLGQLGSDSLFAEPYMVRSPHRVHVGDDVRVDRGAVLSLVEDYGGVKFDPELRIGDGAMIGTDLLLHCAGSIEIGDRVAISARVYIGDSFRDYEDPTVPPLEMPMADPEPVRICDDAFLGAGVAVLPGVTIGERAIVSAGSVVTRDVPPRTIVFGNPARVVRSWDSDAGKWVTGPLRTA
jgi:acetyltransferase-like isoleucine patch superfamily enzyme